MQGRATIDEEQCNGKLPRRGLPARRGKMRLCLLVLCGGLVFRSAVAVETDGETAPILVQVDCEKSTGTFRPLHGINKGPLVAGGLIDLRPAQRALAIPWIRLHDCHRPNPDVVDLHVVFPSDTADPAQPDSYAFARTDEYLAAIRETRANIIYRLGESIDHSNDRRFTRPPKDPARWAEASLGIIRHYNEGWANGFHYAIRYWEIWNEPENRPAMWSGTDDDYLQLYKTTARRIKQTHPALSVGGPAAGHVGTFADGVLKPSNFMARFLEMCRTENVPLDFFSWHFYGDDPAQIVMRAIAIRRWLDANGFTKTESHLNEWNYLPANNWAPLGRNATATARRAHYAKIAGTDGGSFLVATLLALQDAPVNLCNLFHGETGGFGLFDEFGVPAKSYEALAAFAHFISTTPERLPIQTERIPTIEIAAGADRTRTTVQFLAANRAVAARACMINAARFPWAGQIALEIRRVTPADSFETIEKRVGENLESLGPILLPATSVTLISLRKP
jgi:hypothetical protein